MTEASEPQLPDHPAEVMMRLVVGLLAPMFLPASGGDIRFARLAAFETVNQYHPRNHIDLIAIAQIVACSLAAVGSLGLAMTENLSLSINLRLRANAVALNRVAEHARRALSQASAEPREPQNEPGHDDNVLTEVVAAQKRIAEALARFQPAEPPAAPETTHPQIKDEEWQAKWASAMNGVAQEFTDDLKNLSSADRETASRRAAMLGSVASQLLASKVPPRPRPGDANIPN